MSNYESTTKLIEDFRKVARYREYTPEERAFFDRARNEYYHLTKGSPIGYKGATLALDLRALGPEYEEMAVKAEAGWYLPYSEEIEQLRAELLQRELAVAEAEGGPSARAEQLVATMQSTQLRAEQYAPELAGKTEAECIEDLQQHVLLIQLWLGCWGADHADTPELLQAGPETILATHYVRQLAHYVQAIWPLSKESAAGIAAAVAGSRPGASRAAEQ